ncbi:MAG TPA: wax ester/triacylglycerol synthase family O-acyltransferase [Frankiaceae bacterium]
MPERLSPRDASLLRPADAQQALHVGSVAVLEPPAGESLSFEALLELLVERLPLLPRLRQRVRQVPAGLGRPVWVDDAAFDLSYHVRRVALPPPGTEAQLRALVARLQSRPLDPDRPLWELYVVEGLERNRVALVSKTHHVLVHGLAAADVGTLVLDVTPQPRPAPAGDWAPRPEPSAVGLTVDAVGNLLRSPFAVAEVAWGAAADVGRTTRAVVTTAAGLLATARATARPAASGPLGAPVGVSRRFATAVGSLAELREVRDRHGGTVHDAVLAVVAGGLRAWLLARGEPMPRGRTVRVLAPLSVAGAADGATDGTTQLPDLAVAPGGEAVAACFVDLPVGEADPVVRLHQISYGMQVAQQAYEPVGARTLVALTGLTPPTLHSLGARVVSGMARRFYSVVVSNVPGPQYPLYAAGARLVALYPVVPLTPGHPLTVGATSYDGSVFFGLLGDREAMPDIDVLAGCLEEALEELVHHRSVY